MRIDIRFHSLQPSRALRIYTERLIASHLDRFSDDVRSVVVRIRDVNGPKGGPDKLCHITVRGRGFDPLVLEELSTDAYWAVDAAIKRTGHALSRRLDRKRRRRNSAEPTELRV